MKRQPLLAGWLWRLAFYAALLLLVGAGAYSCGVIVLALRLDGV